MTTQTMTRSILTALRLTRPARPRKTPEGPAPKWLDDPDMARQLLKDTGLSREDLTGRPSHDPDLPFFMQRDFW